MSLLLAQSGHHGRANQCPLSGVKRTSRLQTVMSAFDPKRTFGADFCYDAQWEPLSWHVLSVREAPTGADFPLLDDQRRKSLGQNLPSVAGDAADDVGRWHNVMDQAGVLADE